MSPIGVVDLCFPIVGGETLSVDHGYALYSALCACLPALHDAHWLGVHPFDGEPVGKARIRLRKDSRLKLRLPAERIPMVLPLAGQRLGLHGSHLRLGAPSVSPLSPSSSLDARCVHVRLTKAPRIENSDLGRRTLDLERMAEGVRAELERQLSALGATGQVELHGKRIVTVRAQRLVGFSVRISSLDPEPSLAVQANGLGGKRAMGCGIFRPTMMSRSGAA